MTNPTVQDAQDLPEVLEGLAGSHPEKAGRDDLVTMMETMVLHPDYPCLGARSVFNRERAQVVVLRGLGTASAGMCVPRSFRTRPPAHRAPAQLE